MWYHAVQGKFEASAVEGTPRVARAEAWGATPRVYSDTQYQDGGVSITADRVMFARAPRHSPAFEGLTAVWKQLRRVLPVTELGAAPRSTKPPGSIRWSVPVRSITDIATQPGPHGPEIRIQTAAGETAYWIRAPQGAEQTTQITDALRRVAQDGIADCATV